MPGRCRTFPSTKIWAWNSGSSSGVRLPRPSPSATHFTISAGCDKAFATCKAKFANQLNFQGFPHLPGNDAAYAYVDGEGVFDGAPLVP